MESRSPCRSAQAARLAAIGAMVMLTIDAGGAPVRGGSAAAAPVGEVSTATPAGAVRALAAAYRALDIGRFAGLLAEDYRFHTYDDHFRKWDLEGFTRTFEIESAGCLFGAAPKEKCPPDLPPVQAVEMTLGDVHLGVDPEHPDSTEQYALVIVDGFDLKIQVPGGDELETIPVRSVFHVVRGDVARLVAGQAADARHWYLRRWIERTDQPVGDATTEESGAFPAGVLAVRPRTNPSDRDLAVVLALPGPERATLTVYDVQGRRCVQRVLSGLGAGEHTLAVGAGARLSPGIYWLRLEQAGREPAKLMVAVR